MPWQALYVVLPTIDSAAALGSQAGEASALPARAADAGRLGSAIEAAVALTYV